MTRSIRILLRNSAHASIKVCWLECKPSHVTLKSSFVHCQEHTNILQKFGLDLQSSVASRIPRRSHSVLWDKGKQNMCVYEYIKRSYRHVKGPVVCVIVRWITKTQIPHAYKYEHILYFYMKKLVARRVRQCLVNYKVWNFLKLAELTLKCPTKHPPPPDHRFPPTPPLSPSLILLLQLFSASLINWSWSQAKSASDCLLYTHSSPWWKMVTFPKTISATGRTISNQPLIKSNR